MAKKLTPSELTAVELADTKEEVAAHKAKIKQCGADELHYKLLLLQKDIKINQLEKALQSHEVTVAKQKREELAQARRDLLKEYAKKHKIKTERWGYDPLTGEIIEDKGEE